MLKADDSAHIAAALKPVLSKDAVLCTDGSRALKAAAKDMGITHRPVKKLDAAFPWCGHSVSRKLPGLVPRHRPDNQRFAESLAALGPGSR